MAMLPFLVAILAAAAAALGYHRWVPIKTSPSYAHHWSRCTGCQDNQAARADLAPPADAKPAARPKRQPRIQGRDRQSPQLQRALFFKPIPDHDGYEATTRPSLNPLLFPRKLQTIANVCFSKQTAFRTWKTDCELYKGDEDFMRIIGDGSQSVIYRTTSTCNVRWR